MTYNGKADVSSNVSGFGNIQYSMEEREFLQRELEQKLGKEDITSRPGPNSVPVHYIETWRAIELANKIFGFNGWSSSIMEIKEDYVDQKDTDGRFNAGVSAIVRISLKDGSFHEDIGYGTADNQKHKGAAIEQAKKKAVSDGLKRALRNFGNALGLTVYDKEHITKIKKASKTGAGRGAPVAPRPVNPFYITGGTSQPTQSQISENHTQHHLSSTAFESGINDIKEDDTPTQDLLNDVHNGENSHSPQQQPIKREPNSQVVPPRPNIVRLPAPQPGNRPLLPPNVGRGLSQQPARPSLAPRLPPQLGGSNKRPNPSPPEITGDSTDNTDDAEHQVAKRIRLSNEE
jgi:DNA repair and recombination protein RAD52